MFTRSEESNCPLEILREMLFCGKRRWCADAVKESKITRRCAEKKWLAMRQTVKDFACLQDCFSLPEIHDVLSTLYVVFGGRTGALRLNARLAEVLSGEISNHWCARFFNSLRQNGDEQRLEALRQSWELATSCWA